MERQVDNLAFGCIGQCGGYGCRGRDDRWGLIPLVDLDNNQTGQETAEEGTGGNWLGCYLRPALRLRILSNGKQASVEVWERTGGRLTPLAIRGEGSCQGAAMRALQAGW